MAEQRIYVDGNDITSFVKSLKWRRNDIDAPGSGRDMNGNMRRGRVAVKVKLQFTCRTMAHDDLAWLSGVVGQETVMVTYLDPYYGTRTAEFYGSALDTAVWQSSGNDTHWDAPSFNLVEV